MVRMASYSAALYLMFAVNAPVFATAQKIEDKTEALRDQYSNGRYDYSLVEELKLAINEGENASRSLREQISTLEKEKQELERIQTVLTSGLVAALITAAVAIFGALSNLRYSRANIQFRQLEVIEKATALHERGLPLPKAVEKILQI